MNLLNRIKNICSHLVQAKFDHCTIQTSDLPKNIKDIVKNIQKDIPKEILVDNKDEGDWVENGLQKLLHITILFGIDNKYKDEMKEIVSKYKDIKVTAEKIHYFDKDKYSVAVIECKSDDLTNLFKELEENIPNENTYDEFIPHITIAYIKKGERLDVDFTPVEFTINKIEMTNTDGDLIKLNNKQIKAERIESLLSDDKDLKTGDLVLVISNTSPIVAQYLRGDDIFCHFKYGWSKIKAPSSNLYKLSKENIMFNIKKSKLKDEEGIEVEFSVGINSTTQTEIFAVGVYPYNQSISISELKQKGWEGLVRKTVNYNGIAYKEDATSITKEASNDNKELKSGDIIYHIPDGEIYQYLGAYAGGTFSAVNDDSRISKLLKREDSYKLSKNDVFFKVIKSEDSDDIKVSFYYGVNDKERTDDMFKGHIPLDKHITPSNLKQLGWNLLVKKMQQTTGLKYNGDDYIEKEASSNITDLKEGDIIYIYSWVEKGFYYIGEKDNKLFYIDNSGVITYIDNLSKPEYIKVTRENIKIKIEENQYSKNKEKVVKYFIADNNGNQISDYNIFIWDNIQEGKTVKDYIDSKWDSLLSVRDDFLKGLNKQASIMNDTINEGDIILNGDDRSLYYATENNKDYYHNWIKIKKDNLKFKIKTYEGIKVIEFYFEDDYGKELKTKYHRDLPFFVKKVEPGMTPKSLIDGLWDSIVNKLKSSSNIKQASNTNDSVNIGDIVFLIAPPYDSRLVYVNQDIINKLQYYDWFKVTKNNLKFKINTVDGKKEIIFYLVDNNGEEVSNYGILKEIKQGDTPKSLIDNRWNELVNNVKSWSKEASNIKRADNENNFQEGDIIFDNSNGDLYIFKNISTKLYLVTRNGMTFYPNDMDYNDYTKITKDNIRIRIKEEKMQDGAIKIIEYYLVNNNNETIYNFAPVSRIEPGKTLKDYIDDRWNRILGWFKPYMKQANNISINPSMNTTTSPERQHNYDWLNVEEQNKNKQKTKRYDEQVMPDNSGKGYDDMSNRFEDSDKTSITPVAKKRITADNIRSSKLGNIKGLDIVLVKGEIIRNLIHIDFTEGGNPQVYKYMPAGEVWIEDSMDYDDIASTIVHEIFEYNIMKDLHKVYDDAHDMASGYEMELRRSFDNNNIKDENEAFNIANTFINNNLNRIYKDETLHKV